jgi:hypothetical protein
MQVETGCQRMKLSKAQAVSHTQPSDRPQRVRI